LVAIVGMDNDERALAVERLVISKARQLEPAVVHPLQLAVRIARPDDLWQRVRQRTISRMAVRPRTGDRQIQRLSIERAYTALFHPKRRRRLDARRPARRTPRCRRGDREQ